MTVTYQSYLIEVRGLKPIEGDTKIVEKEVVSYRGTWVETTTTYLMQYLISSYLIEVRGLKQRSEWKHVHDQLSYLIEVRGLKPVSKSGSMVKWCRIL